MGKLTTSTSWFGGRQGIVCREPAEHPHRVAEELLATERTPISLSKRTLAHREVNVTEMRQRWENARPGRRVIVAQGRNDRFAQQWVAILIEDDKGVARAHGATWADALRRAIAQIGLIAADDDS